MPLPTPEPAATRHTTYSHHLHHNDRTYTYVVHAIPTATRTTFSTHKQAQARKHNKQEGRFVILIDLPSRTYVRTYIRGLEPSEFQRPQNCATGFRNKNKKKWASDLPHQHRAGCSVETNERRNGERGRKSVKLWGKIIPSTSCRS